MSWFGLDAQDEIIAEDRLANLHNLLGNRISLFGADDLVLEGFDATIVSLDKNNDGYNTYKRAIIEGRHALCNHELLKRETRELQSVRGKVNHPRGGSKDLSDAVAGATYGAFMKLGTVYGEENVNFALTMLDTLGKKKSGYEMIAQFARNPSQPNYFRYGGH